MDLATDVLESVYKFIQNWA